jgi:hypothetical protein
MLLRGKGLATVGAWAVAALIAAPSAFAGDIISPAGPLTRIATTSTLGCFVQHDGAPAPAWIPGQFYGNVRDAPEYSECGTVLTVNGHSYGPKMTGYDPLVERTFTPVRSDPVIGDGTPESPFVLRTVVAAGDSGVTVEQIDSYVEGDDSYRSEVRLTNTSPVSRSVRLTRAGGCTFYFSFQAIFVGTVSPAGGITCAPGAFGGLGSQGERHVAGLEPETEGSSFYASLGADLWSAVQTGAPLPNTCAFWSCQSGQPVSKGATDTARVPAAAQAVFGTPAMALSWGANLNPTDSTSFALTSSFDSSTWGAVATADVAVSATPENVVLDEAVTYEVTAGWFDLFDTNGMTVSAVTARLPEGATYVAGSATSGLGGDPVVGGKTLTFWVPRPEPFTFTVGGEFKVKYSTPGRKALTVGGLGQGLMVQATADVAPVNVVDPNPPPAPPEPGRIPDPPTGSSDVVLVSPDPDAHVNEQQTFRWEQADGATSYDLVIDEAVAATTAGTEATLPADVASGAHSWRVVANSESAPARSSLRRGLQLARTPQVAAASLSPRGETAMRYRPLLYFDSDERYRPVTARSLFGERQTDVRRYAAHQKGPKAWETALLKQPVDAESDLFGTRQMFKTTYHFDNPSGVLSFPDTSSDPRCRGLNAPKNPKLGRVRLSDCDTGDKTGIYYHIAEPNPSPPKPEQRRSLQWIDWWWFFRNNPVTGGSHEGDWEGISVAVSPRTGAVGLVAFAAHEGSNRYLDGVVRLEGGRRPRVYIAKGTHASYPRPCEGLRTPGRPALSFIGPCSQEYVERGRWTPNLIAERRYDGESPWGRNSDAACLAGRNCLIELSNYTDKTILKPDEAPELKPAPSTWNAWKGHWGNTRSGSTGRYDYKSPRSPGQQDRFRRPWRPDEQCGIPLSKRKPDSEGYFSRVPPQNDECAEIRKAYAASQAEPAVPVGEGGSCAEYAGPGIAAAVCDQRQLTGSGELGEMTFRGTTALGSSRPEDESDTAPGIAQLAGEPIAAGSTITVTGTASAATEWLVRVQDGTGVATVVVNDLRIAQGGTASFTAAANGGGTLARGDGSSVAIAPAHRSPGPPLDLRLSGAKRIAKKRLQATVSGAAGRWVILTASDIRGREIVSRSLKITRPKQRVKMNIRSTRRQRLVLKAESSGVLAQTRVGRR